MALTTTSIAAVTADLNTIKQNFKLIVDVPNAGTNSFKWVLQNNDMAKLAEGTLFGKEQQEKLEKLIALVEGQLSQQVTTLINQTERFLERQTELNRTGK